MSGNDTESTLKKLRMTLGECTGSEAVIRANDVTLNSAVTKEQQGMDAEYDSRNSLYTQLLQKYIEIYTKKSISKRRYKFAFFVITMSSFIGIIAGGMVIILFTVQAGNNSLSSVSAVVGSVAGMVSSLIIIPRIIAEHLFPVDEESNMLDMVKSMQENDSRIRKILFHVEEDGV